MFERRLKIFLLIVFGISLVLCLRALQIQVFNRREYEKLAEKFNNREEFIDTIRGRILDARGRELAVDEPCIDAVIAYPAIPLEPEPKWLDEEAGRRLGKRLGEEYTRASRARRAELRKEEIPRLRQDLDRMWAFLARCEDMDERKLEDIRQSIVRKVETRKRWIWYHNYQKALGQHAGREPEPWYLRWLVDDTRPPQLDEFRVQVEDEITPHPVLKAIKPKTVTLLGKELDRFPGLSLRPGVHRAYPYREAGAHWIGSLSRVTREDVARDPHLGHPLRGYDSNDLIGRGGVEALAEPTLRGQRGLIEREVGASTIKSETPAVPGRDVQVTIDIELQHLVQEAFKNVRIEYKQDGERITETFPYLHGAAVVIDVESGNLLALASNPGFDPNQLEQDYVKLVTNTLDKPLFNRATLSSLEPGSTVKPLVGLWGIKCGAIGVHDTIECTGYMIVNGRQVRWNRCWVASKFGNNPMVPSVAHHPIPVPHATGFLTLADALERSCNVFFQAIAERLGFDRVAEGMAAFGLGRPTGIGLPERAGLLPRASPNIRDPRGALWSVGIGQGHVAATPLQMANAAATIARGGVWVRPTLVADAGKLELDRATSTTRPAREDLGLSPEAIAMAKQGMWDVVHSAAGTGKNLGFAGAYGKTGTAQAAVRMVPVLDSKGEKVPKLDEVGQPVTRGDGSIVYEMQPLTPSTRGNPNPIAPWYLGSGNEGTDLSHAWFIGFAPKENPKIAFCVMIEYGGSGGLTAAAVAKEVLGACVEKGYLPRE